MLIILTLAARDCKRRQSRLVRTSPTKNAFRNDGIALVASVDKSCPMAEERVSDNCYRMGSTRGQMRNSGLNFVHPLSKPTRGPNIVSSRNVQACA